MKATGISASAIVAVIVGMATGGLIAMPVARMLTLMWLAEAMR